MHPQKAEDLVRRLAAALRAMELYALTHPHVQRSIDALTTALLEALQATPTIVFGFVSDAIIVDAVRLPKANAMLVGFGRDLRDRDVEKVIMSRGLTRDEVRQFLAVLSDRKSPVALPEQLTRRGVRHIALGRIVVEEAGDQQTGVAAARRVYQTAVETADTLWQSAKAGEK